MSILLMPVPKLQFLDANGDPYSGGKLYTYLAGTSTPTTTYSDSAGTTPNTNPIILDSAGRCTAFIDCSIKIALYDADDVLVFTQDNVSAYGVTDSTTQWTATGLTPTYVSGTQFSVTGDETTIFPVGTRVRIELTSGYIYGTVSAVSYSTVTAVTVLLDSGSIDATIASVATGVISVSNNALPRLPIPSQITTTATLNLTHLFKTVLLNHATTAFTIALPAANTVPSGSWIKLKNIGAAIVTISTAIDGVENRSLYEYEELVVFTDGTSWYGATLSDRGVPIGSIVPFIPGYFGDGSNGSFTYALVSANTIAAVNTLLNSKGWYVCNGAAPNTPKSPIFNASDRYLPNLTDDRFLMGDTVAAGTGGANSSNLAHTHTTGDHALTEAELATHNHTVSVTNTSSAATITYDHVLASKATANLTLPKNSQTSSPSGPTENDLWWDTDDDLLYKWGGSSWAEVTSTMDLAASIAQTGGANSVSVNPSAHTHTASSGNIGSGTAHNHGTTGSSGSSSQENRPVYLSCFYIMRVF